MEKFFLSSFPFLTLLIMSELKFLPGTSLTLNLPESGLCF